MRWFIGILIALNLGILAWGWMGDDEQPNAELALPGVGSIRLVGEPAVAAEPVAVPIPAPPRTDGVMTPPADPVATGDAATATGAQLAATEPPTPLTEEPPAPVVVAPLAMPKPAPVVATPKPPVATPLVPAPAEVVEKAAPVVDLAPAPSKPAGRVPAQVVDAQPVISAPEPRFVPEPEVLLSAKAALQCQRIGPFADAASAKATQTVLAKRGTVSAEQITGQVPAGHWVLVPPQGSRNAAMAVADRLKANGIKDFWVVSKGPVKHGISLGVFSQKDNADRFASRARAKGFTVEIRPKTKSGKQTWLNYQGSPVKSADIPATPGVKIASKDCP